MRKHRNRLRSQQPEVYDHTKQKTNKQDEHIIDKLINSLKKGWKRYVGIFLLVIVLLSTFVLITQMATGKDLLTPGVNLCIALVAAYSVFVLLLESVQTRD